MYVFIPHMNTWKKLHMLRELVHPFMAELLPLYEGWLYETEKLFLSDAYIDMDINCNSTNERTERIRRRAAQQGLTCSHKDKFYNGLY